MNGSFLVYIDRSSKAHNHLKNLISYEQEEVWVIGLTSMKTLIKSQKIFMGSLDSCPLHPREVLKFVLLNNCHSYLICHSHPSGDPSPSRQDKNITKNLLEASKIMGVNLEDHIIYSKSSYFSFKDHFLI